MKELFYEMLKEAQDGKIVVDGEEWPIGFNTMIHADGELQENFYSAQNLSTLMIEDEDLFFQKLHQYLEKIPEEEKSRNRKLVLAYLFVNATTEDFMHPIEYIDRRIDYLDDRTFEDLESGLELNLDGLFDGYHLEVKNDYQSFMMETPHKMSFTILSNEGYRYHLPTISYGMTTIDNKKTCDVYSILKPKDGETTPEEEKFRKKVSRQLYKLNSGISSLESQEYQDYLKNGLTDDYYPENISDVSVSAVMSLSIFTTLLRNHNILDVRGIPYLPLRYLSREIAAKEVTDISLRDRLQERNQKIQTNVTDKFIRTFRRVEQQLDNAEITAYPYENDEFLHLKLGKEKKNSR